MYLRRFWFVIAAALAAGCGGSPSPAPLRGRDWNRHPAVVTLTGAQEIDALGDLHGDPEVATRLLAMAGLITPSAPHHWMGGRRVLVITGDVIDKGASATPLIDLLEVLEDEAATAGGRVVVTLGNHEAEFVANPSSDKVSEFRAELELLGLDPDAVARGETKYGQWLFTRPVAALIDGWFFCHGGNSGGLSAQEIAHAYEATFDADGNANFDDPFLVGDDSLLEASGWWGPPGTATGTATSKLDYNLAVLPADHLVFGHDPGELDFPGDPAGRRTPGEMAMRYGGRLFLIDVGMSYAVGYSDGALLRITRAPDSVTAVLANGTTRTLWP